MYNLDSKKLLRSVSGSQSLSAIVRWCIDFMYTIENAHTVEVSKLKKAWPFEDKNFDENAFKTAPEFLTVIIKDEVCYAFSRPLKNHYEQERILKQLGQRVDIDDISASGKLKESLEYKEVEVFKDHECTALIEYKGMLPTRSYQHSREVFCVTGSFYSYLKEKYKKIDVDAKLLEIHKYLSCTEEARRHHTSMKRYVEAWVSGDLLKLNKIKRKKSQISKNKFYEDFLSDTE